MTRKELQLDLVKKYKELIALNRLKDEKYKWELVQNFKGRPNLDAVDFEKEVRDLNYINLTYYNSRRVLLVMVQQHPIETKSLLAILFDEQTDLISRIHTFQSEFAKLYRDSGQTLAHHQDERTISAYLAVKYPEKYPFYKYSFYRGYCNYLNEKPAKTGEQFVHYIQLNKELADLLIEDSVLQELKSKFLGSLTDADPNNLLLAQDVLFQLFEQNEAKEIDIVQVQFETNEFDFFILFVQDIVAKFKLDYNDERVMYNVRDKRLIFIVGQRYAVVLAKEGKKTFFKTISTEKETEIFQEFSGTNPNPFFNTFSFENRGDLKLELHYIAIENELKRTTKSSFKNEENIDLKNIIYNLEESQNAVTNIVKKESTPMEKNLPLNQILYGPPGTGKTYKTKELAVKIIDGIIPNSRTELSNRYKELIDKGQIQFTTFHQSMSYEDFVEGIKPKMEEENDDLTYMIEDGIFMKSCVEASFSKIRELGSKESEELMGFSTAFDSLIQEVQESLAKGEQPKFETKNGGFLFVDGISPQGNFLMIHKEGKQNYPISKNRLSKLNTAFPDLNSVNNIDLEFRKIIGGSNSTANWAVLNAIRKRNFKKNNAVPAELDYFERKEFAKSLSPAEHRIAIGVPSVLIIDEINRGNVSSIFGELITLIEKDKRAGEDEMIEVILPYSKTEFSVPNNLYIIGTMNTADRSVEALDTALRRRFSFVEMMPEPNKLDNNFEGVNLQDVLTIINNRIELLVDRDHKIGHSYFMNLNGLADLAVAFNDKIVPLLQEYFYGDYGKIGLVLGEGFVEIQDNKDKKFSSFKYEGKQDFITPTFNLKKVDSSSILAAIEMLQQTEPIKTPAITLADPNQN